MGKCETIPAGLPARADALPRHGSRCRHATRLSCRRLAGPGDCVLVSSTLHTAGYVCTWIMGYPMVVHGLVGEDGMRSPDASDKCVRKVGISLRACLVCCDFVLVHHIRPTCTDSTAPQAGKVTQSQSEKVNNPVHTRQQCGSVRGACSVSSVHRRTAATQLTTLNQASRLDLGTFYVGGAWMRGVLSGLGLYTSPKSR